MHSRCVLVFALSPDREAASKRIRGGAPLFEQCILRIQAEVAKLADVDLVLVDETRQRGGSFGERLESAFADARARGWREIVAVPGDVPGLESRHLEAAFAALRRSELVLGPSPDGGVWLIGARGDVATAFAGVPWRTAGVLEQLLRNVASSELLAPLADVDRPDDLHQLARDASLDRAMLSCIRAVLATAREATSDPEFVPDALLVVRAHPSHAPPRSLAAV